MRRIAGSPWIPCQSWFIGVDLLQVGGIRKPLYFAENQIVTRSRIPPVVLVYPATCWETFQCLLSRETGNGHAGFRLASQRPALLPVLDFAASVTLTNACGHQAYRPTQSRHHSTDFSERCPTRFARRSHRPLRISQQMFGRDETCRKRTL